MLNLNVRKQMAVQLTADGDNAFRITLENPTNMTIKLGQIIPAGLLMLVAHGGIGPYAFEPTAIGDSSGSSGLSVDSEGQITGTATDVGTFQFIGAAQDGNDELFEDTFSVTVEHLLTWAQDAPDDTEDGLDYGYQFKATGGTGAVTYSLVSGTLPSALSLGSDGLLSGHIIAAPGITYPFVVRATDAGSGDSIDADSSITIFQILTKNIGFGLGYELVVGSPTTIDASILIDGGRPPYTASLQILNGAVPGLTFSVDANTGNLTLVASQEFSGALVNFRYTDSLGVFAFSQAIALSAVSANQRITIIDHTGTDIAVNPASLIFGTGLRTFQDSNGDIHVEATGGGDSSGPPTGEIFYADDILTASAGDDLLTLTNLPIDQKDTTLKVSIPHTIGDSSGGFTTWEEIYPQPGTIFSCTDIVVDSNGIHSSISPPFAGGEKVRVQYLSYDLMGNSALSQGGTPQYLDQIVMPLMAHSLKRIVSSWTGNLIDVTNTGGTITGSIGQDGSGNLDVAALVALSAGGDLFVSKWYDQTGNNYHLVSVGAWPPIVASGTYIGYLHFGRTTGDILTLDVAVSATPAPTGFIGKYYAGFATNPGAVSVNSETNSSWTGGQAGFIEVSLGTGTPTYQLGYSANGSPPTQNRIIGFALAPYTSCTNWTNLLDTSQSVITDAIKSFVNGSPQSTTGTINDDGIASPTIPPFQYNLGARSGNAFPSQMEITSHVIFDQDTSAHRLAIEAIIV